ncbi:MAG: hypothetical protein IT305_31930 [Chloroflexi bacterium]|nr:hypothetical protein [Chloroflexota bacterium]
MPLEVALESTVVVTFASLAAAALTAALNYLLEREWPAFVFLVLAASTSLWYGYIFITVVRAAFRAA